MTYRERPSFTEPVAPKCPAIILNNSGSMMAKGRLEKTVSITSSIARYNNGADFYVNDARTGIPDYVTHIDGDIWRYTQPLLPMMTGDDYFNTLGLAAVISEYPAGIHLIDDGDDIGRYIPEALHLLKSMKHPGYMHPVLLYILSDQWNRKTLYLGIRKVSCETFQVIRDSMLNVIMLPQTTFTM